MKKFWVKCCDFLNSLRRPIEIQLSSGKYFNFRRFEPADFNIYDIASSLSKLCRFTGHVKHFYSVAEHSVLVSYLVPPELALEALLHDREEAYTNDVVTPLKNTWFMWPFRRLARRIQIVSAKTFGLPEKESVEVKVADDAALKMEKLKLKRHGTADLSKWWGPNWVISARLMSSEFDFFWQNKPLLPEEAESAFLERFGELTEKENLK